MSHGDSHLELASLLSELIEERLSPSQFERLGQILETDAAARAIYRDHLSMHAMLHWRWHQEASDEQRGSTGEGIGGTMTDGSPVQHAGSRPFSSPPAIQLPVSALPAPHFFPITLHGTLGCFSEGMPLAYLLATVVTGLGLLIGSLIHVSQPEQIVHNSVPSMPVLEPKVVGRITGMVDCRWEKKGLGIRNWGLEERARAENRQSPIFQSLIPNPQSLVALGDKYALASGLMEITYDTGAKVILQGPVTYEIESNGGYLSVGRLTGKLEGKVASGQWPVASKSEIRNQKLEISNPTLSTIHYSLFTIRTPTATVTDLGTEFGVEVSESGGTETHVFQGRVELRCVGADGQKAETVVLPQGESARVEVGPGNVTTMRRMTARSEAFARHLSQPDRLPLPVFNTGQGLKVGQSDPHWQLVAISNDPMFKPRPAIVAPPLNPTCWWDDESFPSRWISLAADGMAGGWAYTFRTTFDLTGYRPNTAVLRVQFVADNYVHAIRLNGRDVPVPSHDHNPPFDRFHTFFLRNGFLKGNNTLEFMVVNAPEYSQMGSANVPNPMGLRVEFEGRVQRE